jgi:predicted nuclease of restriction endonuclease-like (RecB) superfamily
MNSLKIVDKDLVEDIKNLIETAKTRAAVAVNSQMTMLYWDVGNRIKEDIIKSERAEYGKQVIVSLAQLLSAEYGKGFTRFSLSRMIKFYEVFPAPQIVATLSQQLTWSHIVELLPLNAIEQRHFYAYMAIESGWSVRDLRHNIHRMTYERTIANQIPLNLNTISLLKNQTATPIMQPNLILKDPYVLDFLGLSDNHYENDLEKAILKEIEKFLLELGTGFSFLARQKRITVDGDHFYIDLLFYNRRLKRMVVLELKKGKFKPEYKGQMEFYLNYLKEYETFPGEEVPIGIILCTEKSSHQIELLKMSESGIHVAEYWTELPPREVFERKVQEIVLQAKENIAKLENKLSDNNSE